MAETPQSSWPGERRPTQEDVPEASQLPDHAFLSGFKTSLLAHPDSRYCRPLFNVQRQDGRSNSESASRAFTYPMSSLVGFPDLPSREELLQAKADFTNTLQRHILLRQLPLRSEDASLPPYLLLACACNGKVLADNQSGHRDEKHVSRNIFHAADQLYTFMVETDNRKSRSIDTILSIALMVTYGTLTADRELWDKAKTVLTHGLTMARRLDIFDLRMQEQHGSSTPAKKNVSSLVAYLFILSCVMGVHHDTPLLINTSQFAMNIPGTGLPLPEACARLFLPSSIGLGLHGTTEEDALLLLAALWSDVIHIEQLSLGVLDIHAGSQSASGGHKLPRYCDPYAPLSPTVEQARVRDRLDTALSTWHATFAATVPDEMVALCYYCKMIVTCPQILQLPSRAGYAPARSSDRSENDEADRLITVNDETSNLAMLVLDYAGARDNDPAIRVEIWLPVIIFHATLAVWANSRSKQSNTARPLRTLSSFIRLLDGLPWPCCQEMSATLKTL